MSRPAGQLKQERATRARSRRYTQLLCIAVRNRSACPLAHHTTGTSNHTPVHCPSCTVFIGAWPSHPSLRPTKSKPCHWISWHLIPNFSAGEFEQESFNFRAGEFELTPLFLSADARSFYAASPHFFAHHASNSGSNFSSC